MKKIIQWLLNDDRGVSSETIVSVMTGCEIRYPDVPHDADDFGRCYRLLELFPEWKYRMKEVAKKHPTWKPLVKNWDELTRSYENGFYGQVTDGIRALLQEVTA